MAKIPFDAHDQLSDRCDGPREYLFLKLPYAISEAEIFKNSIDALTVVPPSWLVVGATRFRIPDHINILGLRALLAYIQWFRERILVVIGSEVVKGALRKFRSSPHWG